MLTEDGVPAAAGSGGAAGASGTSGGAEDGEFGVDPNLDPELAMVRTAVCTPTVKVARLTRLLTACRLYECLSKRNARGKQQPSEIKTLHQPLHPLHPP